MAVKKCLYIKNIKKKVQEHTKGFEIKLITTIISGLFISQAAVANNVSSSLTDDKNGQSHQEKTYIYTGQAFNNALELPNDIIADKITFDNCTYKTNLLKIYKINADIGSVKISGTTDVYTEQYNVDGEVYGNTIFIYGSDKVRIDNVEISGSTLTSDINTLHQAFFHAGYINKLDVKTITLNDVNVTNQINYHTQEGILFDNIGEIPHIEKLTVDGFHAEKWGEAIHFLFCNKKEITVDAISINNITSAKSSTGLSFEGNHAVIKTGKVGIANIEANEAYGLLSVSNKSLQITNGLTISNIIGNNKAIGIWSDDITIDGGISISGIYSKQGNAYAIVARDKEGAGSSIVIKSDSNIINRIRGDISFDNNWSSGAKVDASFMNPESIFEGKVHKNNDIDDICNLSFDNGAHWAVTGDSWTTNLHIGNGAYVDLMADHNPTVLKASKFTANGGSVNLHFDPSGSSDRVEIGEGSGSFDIVLDVSNGDQIGKPNWKNFIITQNKGNLHLGQIKYKDGAVKAFKVAYWDQPLIYDPGSLTSTGENGRWIVYLPEIIDGLPLEPPSKVPALPLEPPSKIPALPLEPPSKVPALPLEPPSKVPALPLEPPSKVPALPLEPPSEVPALPLEPVEPIEPPVDQNPGFDKPPTTPEVDQILALGTSAAQGLGMLQETEDLRTRMGDIRSGESDGVWARTFARQDRAYGSYGHSFKQETYGIYFGADRAWRHNSGSSLVGLAMHLGKSDQKEIGGGEAGSAKMDQYSLKAYGTWMSDRGSFIDIIGLLGYYDTELSGVSNTGKRQLKADYNTWGYGLSAEIGHRFALEQPTSTWFVEPTAQLSWYRVLGKDFSTNTGIKVEQSDTDFLVGRAGLAVGKTIPLGQNDGQSLTFTLKGGMLYQFDGDQTIKVSGTDDSSLKLQALSMNGARAYYGSTVDWRIDDAWRLYGQISREEGSGYTKDYDFSVGVQYRW